MVNNSPPLGIIGLTKNCFKVLNAQVEEVREKSHKLVDILASAGPSRIPLPINEAILKLIKTFCQTLSFSFLR